MSSSSAFGSGTSFGSTPLGTSPFYDVAGLIDGILRVTGHSNPAGETSKRAALIVIMNNKYQEICAGRNWRWLRASYDFSLTEPYPAGGSVWIANGSYDVNGIGTLFSAAILPKDIIYLGGTQQVYRVASVVSNTLLRLETPFAGESLTAPTATGFTIARNQYKLPKETGDILQLTVDGLPRGHGDIVFVGPTDFRRAQNNDPTLLGPPRLASLMRRETDDDAQYMEVWPAPDQDYNCHIDYNVRILYLEDKTTCYPIIPDRFRAVLYYAALSEFYYTVMRDAANADRARADYQNFYARIANDKQVVDGQASISPARNYLRRSGRIAGFRDIETFGRDD